MSSIPLVSSVETEQRTEKYYSIRTVDREGFKGCVIEVPQPIDPQRAKLLERLGGIVHIQIQKKDAPAIILVPEEAYHNIATEDSLTQKGYDLEGTVLGEALTISGAVRKLLEGDK